MKTSCEFRFGFWDVTAREDATFYVTNNQPWARVEDINGEEPVQMLDVATLEPNFGWPLNGTKKLLPRHPEQYAWGWWSEELSQEDKSFADPPKLIIPFTKNHSSAGITLMFHATLPGLINIKWYGANDSLLSEKDFAPDDMVYFCENQVEDYYKLEITVKTMSAPHRFLRCIFILFGALEIIGDSRICKAELTEEIDPTGLTLPIQTLLLSFFTAHGGFQLLDPSGAYKFFQWKQQITGTAAVDGVERPVGTYYLQEASGFTDNIVDLTLVDIVGILDTVNYDGGIYTQTPLVELLDEILASEGVAYELDPALENETISGHLPICSKRQALQQIAFAIGALIDTTRSDAMHIYPAPIEVSHAIGAGRKVADHKVKLEELITRVDVTAHSYRLSEEVKELVKSEMTAGQHVLHFSTPSFVSQATGATLITNHPNYAIVSVSTDGEVILTGREYVDDTTVRTVQTSPIPAGAKSSAKSVAKATLVDNTKAAKAAQRVYDYYQLRYTDDGEIIPSADIERAGQMIELQSLNGKSLTGAVERLVVDLSGGHLAKITMRAGFAPGRDFITVDGEDFITSDGKTFKAV